MTCIVRPLEGGRWEVGVFGDGTDTTYLRICDSKPEVEAYIHWLNGGVPSSDLDRLVHVLESVAERLDRIWRSIGRCS